MMHTRRTAARRAVLLLVIASSGCVGRAVTATVAAPNPAIRTEEPLVPRADHHQHVASPAAAAHSSDSPLPSVVLPRELALLLELRAERWNDAARLAELFTDSAVVLDDDGPVWAVGRDAVSGYLAALFVRAHWITPVAYGVHGSGAYIVGYYSRDIESGVRHFGHVHLSLVRGSDARWRIAAESPRFPGVYTQSPRTADDVIAELDAAATERAVLLSTAYWFGSARGGAPDEYEKVRAENDWAAAEGARYPGRLVAFCGVNPLRDYAVEEITRCARHTAVRGIKLHFGNSRVNLRDSSHVVRLRRVFSTADAHGLAIVAHLWTGPEYEQTGGTDASVFLTQLLPAAPRVTVQIAHMAGGGRSTDAALAVFAEAIAANDPGTRQLYFDVATLIGGQSDEGLRRDVERMRQIGLDRILWGSDIPPSNPVARDAWLAFRIRVPLTEAEFRTVAGNVAPYLR
jgi:uncharacterized protein